MTLCLNELASRHPGLTKAIGDTYSEAAAVCLNRHYQPPVDFDLDCDGIHSTCGAEWTVPDERTQRAWGNETDTTEAGAYGVSLAALEAVRGLVAISRAETFTGADYYVAPVGPYPEDLENCLRLEVSGTDKGGKTVLQQRLRAKIEQARAGNSNLPAIASVVGFREHTVIMAEVRM